MFGRRTERALLSSVEQARYPFKEESETENKIDLLFWGVEVTSTLPQRDQLRSKYNVVRSPPNPRTVLEHFVKKGVFLGGSQSGLAENLAKFILERHKLDNRKFWQSFAGINTDISDAIPKMPSTESALSLVKIIAAEIRTKLEKRLMQEIEEFFKILKLHFLHFSQTLEKSPPAESYSTLEVDWRVGSTALPLEAAAGMRETFNSRYNDITDLDFNAVQQSSMPRSSSKNAVLKFWQSRYKPVHLMNLPHVRAIEDFLRGSCKTLAGSAFSKLGIDFGMARLIPLTISRLLLFVDSAVESR